MVPMPCTGPPALHGSACLARVRLPCTGPPASPTTHPSPLSASPHLNLRGLVFNFINTKFLLLFFSVADFVSSDKVFYIYIDNVQGKCKLFMP